MPASPSRTPCCSLSSATRGCSASRCSTAEPASTRSSPSPSTTLEDSSIAASSSSTHSPTGGAFAASTAAASGSNSTSSPDDDPGAAVSPFHVGMAEPEITPCRTVSTRRVTHARGPGDLPGQLLAVTSPRTQRQASTRSTRSTRTRRRSSTRSRMTSDPLIASDTLAACVHPCAHARWGRLDESEAEVLCRTSRERCCSSAFTTRDAARWRQASWACAPAAGSTCARRGAIPPPSSTPPSSLRWRRLAST